MASDATPQEPGAQEPELESLLRSIRAYIEYQSSIGLHEYPILGRAGANDVPESKVNRAQKPGDKRVTESTFTTSFETLDELRQNLGDCTRCKLSQGRTKLVFGVGNPHAELMFVGEGPGRDEDLQGEPFVGRAGKLLTDIITKGMKIGREDVYIANVVKCRPPQNRNPESEEVSTCRPFLEQQIALIQPRVLVALGKFAAQTLLDSKTTISRLRGNWHDYKGIKLMPTLHPAYLLRNPNDKRLVWDDIQMVMDELGKDAS